MSLLPPSGSQIYWRIRGSKSEFRYGYVTYAGSYNMIRLGRWNGDSFGGSIVDIADIEWRKA